MRALPCFFRLYEYHKHGNVLKKRPQVPQESPVEPEKFIYCLEAVDDVEADPIT
jgi:hypothetical protein